MTTSEMTENPVVATEPSTAKLEANLNTMAPTPSTTPTTTTSEATNGTTDSSAPEETVKVVEKKKGGGGKKRKPGRRWTKAEDAVLKELVEKHGNRHWKRIAEAFAAKSGTQRSDVQCLHRWNKCLKPGLVKGPWRGGEDQIISGMIERYGMNNVRWSVIAKMLPGRLGKQVRERWINHLDPTIIKSEWTAKEDENLSRLHSVHGNRWKLIAQKIPGRSENGVKNRWHSLKQSNGKEGKGSRASTKRKASKAAKTAKAGASKARAPPQAGRRTKKSNSVLGKRLVATSTGENSAESSRLPVDSKVIEMAKVTQHAQSLLQMSENYKMMANLMLCSNGAASLAANSFGDAKLAQGSLLATGSKKRMKFSTTEVLNRPANGSFRNLLALQELSKGSTNSKINGRSLNSGATIGQGFSQLPNVPPITSLATSGLQPSSSGSFQAQSGTGSLSQAADASLAQSFPHCYNMFKQISASQAGSATATGGAAEGHKAMYSVYI